MEKIDLSKIYITKRGHVEKPDILEIEIRGVVYRASERTQQLSLKSLEKQIEGTARDLERTLLARCAGVVRDASQCAENQIEANVFRLAAMVIRHDFPSEYETLMRASDQYFELHPDEKLTGGQVVRNGWVIDLPRLRDGLNRTFKRKQERTSAQY